MSAMASRITGVSIVYSTVCSGTDQENHQSSVSLAFVRGIHRWPVNFPHKGPVTRKMFPFNDVIMIRILQQEGQNLINARSGNASREVVHLTIHPSEIRLWCWISNYLQKHAYRADIFSTSYEIVPRWKLQDLADEKLTSRQMMTNIYDAIWRQYATTG